MSGWLVKIVDPDNRARIRLFAAAENDPRAALIAVHRLANAAANQPIDAVGPISEEIITKLGIRCGSPLDLTS